MNVILSLHDCRLSSGDTQRWWGCSNFTCCYQKIEFFALTGGGDAKTSPSHPNHLFFPLMTSILMLNL